MIDTLQTISADFLREKLQSDARPVLINALSTEQYVAKRIPGSISVPAEHIDRIEDIVPDKDQDIVVYCANSDCTASPEAAEALIEKGYKNVWDFEEGIAGWKEAGFTLTGHDTQ